jgi:4-diphosphocytidyl-2-C-methyl-D-erythritol kinase
LPHGESARSSDVIRTPDRGLSGPLEKPITLSAPAKLTVSLRITGVRPDGYHVLDSEMVSIDLADTLTFEPGVGLAVVDQVEGGMGLADVPAGPGNLVSRALELVGRQAAVRLVKRIPSGAGLGGGSADAAAVLRWARRTDVELAVTLGADVPFCVLGGRARVRGIGEVIEPLPFEDRRFLVLLPPVAVHTAAVYRMWDYLSPGPLGREDQGMPGSDNDLERAAISVAPTLKHWRDILGNATGCQPQLAGSGSSWFVEGTRDSPGVDGREFLVLGDLRAPLLAVRTVPTLPLV